MAVSAYDIPKKCAVALVWIEAMQDLDSRFQKIREAFAQADTTEEKHRLLALAWEIVQQAEDQLAQLRSKIQRMPEAHCDGLNT
jgi:septation ring formation regulator EzrA